MVDTYKDYDSFRQAVASHPDNVGASDSDIFNAWKEYESASGIKYGDDRDSALGFSVDNAQKLAGAGVRTLGDFTGIDMLSDAGQSIMNQQDKDIAEGQYKSAYQGSVRDNYNQGGFGQALGKVWESLQENAAYSGTALAGAGLAAVTAPLSLPLSSLILGGSTIASGAMGAGEVAMEMEDKGVEVNAGKALLGGAIISILDRFSAGSIIPKDKLLGMTGNELIDTLVQSGKKDAAKAIAKELVKKTGTEVGTELLQESSIVGLAQSEGAKYNQEELIDRAIDTAAISAGMGGVFAGADVATDAYRANSLQSRIDALKSEQEAAKIHSESQASKAAQTVADQGGDALSQQTAYSQSKLKTDTELAKVNKVVSAQAEAIIEEDSLQQELQIQSQAYLQPSPVDNQSSNLPTPEKQRILKPRLDKLQAEFNALSNGEGDAVIQETLDSGMSDQQAVTYIKSRLNERKTQILTDTIGRKKEATPEIAGAAQPKQTGKGSPADKNEQFGESLIGQRGEFTQAELDAQEQADRQSQMNRAITEAKSRKQEAEALRDKALNTPGLRSGKESEPVDTPSYAVNNEKDLSDKERINKENFTPTHELQNGTPVIATDEKNVYVDKDGAEWEESDAIEVNAPSAELNTVANKAATSPLNSLPEPTEAQKEAGNYKKGHIKIQGLDIAVENPKGSTRKGVDRDGKEWANEIKSHYGYIKGTVGNDKDHVDVFIGDKPEEADKVYVVDQVNPETGKFDEHKVMIGYESKDKAKEAYQENYDKDWKGLANITEMPINAFKLWVKNKSNTSKPLAKDELKEEAVKAINDTVKDALSDDDRSNAVQSDLANSSEEIKNEGSGSLSISEAEINNVYNGLSDEDKKALQAKSRNFWKGEKFIDIAQKVVDSTDVFLRTKNDFSGNDISILGSTPPLSYELSDGRRKMKIPAALGRYINLLDENQKSSNTAKKQAEPENTKENTPAREKIKDFGKKIGGARKDLSYKLSDDLTTEDIASQPLSKTFPEPNYEKLISEGANKRDLALVALFRSEIPNKPRTKSRVNSWVSKVKSLRSFASDIMSDALTSDEVINKLRESGGGLTYIADTVQLLEKVDPSLFKQASKYRIENGAYTKFAGKDYKPAKTIYTMKDAKGRTSFKIFGDTAESIVDAVIDRVKQDADAASTKKKQSKISIYTDTRTKDVFLGYKGAGGVARLKTGFNTTQEAGEYLYENRQEIEDKLAEMRDVVMRRQSNEERKGKTWREGDVTPEIFDKTFGFRGVEFGNWVEGDKRQADLNNAYDALMDLADVVGIPPKALSLNGELGLAFGSRGTRGAKAHYEADYVVINLTKKDGAGSLAHEWLHAMDNYFGKMDKDLVTGGAGQQFASEQHRDRYMAFQRTHRATTDADFVIRREMYDAWRKVEESIKGGKFSERAKKLDSVKSKKYWNTTIEKAARSFEKYIVMRLRDRNESNDYLANIYEGTEHGGTVYPTDGEMGSQGITAAWDNFFSTVETKETDKGVALYSKGKVANSVTRQQATTQLSKDKQLASAINAGKLKIVKSESDLPIGAELFSRSKADIFRSYGAEVYGDKVILYRGANLPISKIKELSYNDYLSSSDGEVDATGNGGARSYGKNVVRFEIPISDVEVTGAGEFLYKGKTKNSSQKTGSKYPRQIYQAYADAYGYKYTDAEVDSESEANVRAVASQSLSDGRDEFNHLLAKHREKNTKYSKKDSIQGAYLDGIAYIVTDGNTAQTLESTAWHELTHAMMDDAGFLTDKQYTALMTRLGNMRKLGMKGKNSFWQGVERRVQSAGTAEKNVLDETAGYAITQHLEGKDVPQGIKKWVNDFISYLKAQWFKFTGQQVGKLQPQELKAMTEGYISYIAKQNQPDTEARSGTALASMTERFNTFFSGMGKALDSKLGKSVNAKMLATQLQNESTRGKWGIKEEEVEWTGIVEWLQEQDGKVTKQEIQDFIESNQVQVEEVELGRLNKLYSELEEKNNGKDFDDWSESDQEAWMDAKGDKSNSTKYKDYTVKGEAENYRELLLTMPEKEQSIIESMNSHARGEVYSSSHWDEKNVLAHIRFDERQDADGNKVLFIHEVQSDWHQDGRKKGYGNSYRAGELSVSAEGSGYAVVDSRGNIVKDGFASYDEARSTSFDMVDGVANAPFKGNAWIMLAMKRMIRHASENGFDKVAWATGEQSADLYSLDKQVDGIGAKENKDGTYVVTANINGDIETLDKSASPEKLSSLVGKELADKITNKEGRDRGQGWYEYADTDLKVGGEGMRSFYDRTLPNLVQKYIKKWGGVVSTVGIDTREVKGAQDLVHDEEYDGKRFVVLHRDDDSLMATFTTFEEASEYSSGWHKIVDTKAMPTKQQGFTITNDMRSSAMRGQPLFSKQKQTDTLESIKETINESELAESVKEPFQKAWQVIKSQAMGGLTLRQLGEVTSRILPIINERYLPMKDAMVVEVNDWMNRGAAITIARSKLSKQENIALSEVQQEATIAGVDPSKRYKHRISQEAYELKVSAIREANKGSDGAMTSKAVDKIEQLNDIIAEEPARKESYDRLKPLYDALSSEAQSVYTSELNYHKSMNTKRLEVIEDRISNTVMSKASKIQLLNSLKEKFEASQVQQPYFPLSRFGEFWVHSSFEGETSFDMFETAKQRDKFKAKIELEGSEILGSGKNLKNMQNLDGVSSSFITDVDKLISGLGDDPMVSELRKNVYDLYLATLPDMNVRKHFIRRKNTRGFNKDQSRAFADSVQHGSKQLGKLMYSEPLGKIVSDAEQILKVSSSKFEAQANQERIYQLQDYLENAADLKTSEIEEQYRKVKGSNKQLTEMYKGLLDIRQSMSNNDVGAEIERLESIKERAAILAKSDSGEMASYAVEELRSAHSAIMNPNVHPLAQAINSFGFVWFLGLTPAAAMVNITQTVIVGMPLIAAKYGFNTASKHLKQATKDFFHKDNDGTFSVEAANLTKDERDAFSMWYASGLLDNTLAHDTAGIAENGINNGSKRHKIMSAASYMFHRAEQFNREVTALAAYRSAIEKGVSHQEAVKVAEKIVWDAHFDYTSANRARFLRGNVARVVAQFKQYSQSIIYLYGRLFHEAFMAQSPSKEEITQARKALAGILATQISLAGAAGLPLAGVTMGVAQLMADLVGDDDEPFLVDAELRQFITTGLVDVFGKKAGSFASGALTNGIVNAATPLNLSGRISHSDLVFRGSDRELSGRNASYDALKSVLGVPAAYFEMPFVMADHLRSDNYMKAAETMLPKFMKDALKSVRYGTEDAKTSNGYIIKDMSASEVLMQLGGFSSSELSEQYGMNNSRTNYDNRLKSRRSKLINNMVNSKSNEGDIDSAQADIDEWNKKHPNNLITKLNIRQSEKGRQRYSERLVDGRFTTNRYKDTNEKFNWVN